MERELAIEGIFEDERQLRDVVVLRKVCYDVEPYYIPDKKDNLVQIGFLLSLYGTFPQEEKDATPDTDGYENVERDLKKIAAVLSQTCNPMHMCEATAADPATVTHASERKMRPDVTVHIPLFDQENFGHPVDDNVRGTLDFIKHLLESAGIPRRRWHE
jgi:hypothetical protein